MPNIFQEQLTARKEQAVKDACVLENVICYTNNVFTPKHVANKLTGEEYLRYDLSFLVHESAKAEFDKLQNLLCEERDSALESGYFQGDIPVTFPVNSCKNMKDVDTFSYHGYYRVFASTFNKPAIVDREVSFVTEGSLLHPGTKINIEVLARANEYVNKKGEHQQSVALSFVNVQIVDAESLTLPVVTRNAPEDVFKKL